MDLTVPIATYNRAAILGEAIESALAQRLPPSVRWELVVVDNNSHDDTKAVVEHYIRTSAVPVCYLFEGRQGKSYALNAGLKRAEGDVIAFTDDDVLVSPEWAATALSGHGLLGIRRSRWTDPAKVGDAATRVAGEQRKTAELLGSGGGCDTASAFVPVEGPGMGRGRQHGVPPERLQRNWRIRRGAWAVRQATGQFRRPRYGRKGTPERAQDRLRSRPGRVPSSKCGAHAEEVLPTLGPYVRPGAGGARPASTRTPCRAGATVLVVPTHSESFLEVCCCLAPAAVHVGFGGGFLPGRRGPLVVPGGYAHSPTIPSSRISRCRSPHPRGWRFASP
jgi:Glycosyl transferase family 2